MPHDWLPLLHELADRADEISTRYFRSSELPVERKPDRSLVTKADLEVESAVRDLLAKRHPELGVFGEEHGEHQGQSGTRLIVDPIDATANFARGLPIYATLLAIEEDGEIVAGLVAAPALHQRWHAARGEGAFCGTRRLRVSRVTAIEDAQVFHGSLAGTEAVPATARIPGLLAQSWRQRGVGDFYQHMLVAEGCGELGVDPIVQPWDIAPLLVIVEEAGGLATTVEGERSIYGGSLLTSNGALHAAGLSVFA
ncbi:inositol monophosphatase family protein [Paraliomyxa miuraensis]|uniref:inositol monophosphatase family protein n=1 Tax=Paraliomyxa miuraensis TaxID=376150 RepID=UPI00225247E8|nr:inositol monophosphatase family protein [Paraliomyxa miuraensis]MCX4240681.1 histidinol phosphatase [Paraliomyxa miuraensis]